MGDFLETHCTDGNCAVHNTVTYNFICRSYCSPVFSLHYRRALTISD